jgi:LPS sulfotransferase NodH
VLHLRRENLLRQFVSGRIAKSTGTYHVRAGDDPERARVAVDPADAVAYMAAMRAREDAYAERFRASDVLAVCYEQLAADPDAELGRIQRWLGVEPRALQPATRRQHDTALPDLVTNYPALVDALAGTAWEPFLA